MIRFLNWHYKAVMTEFVPVASRSLFLPDEMKVLQDIHRLIRHSRRMIMAPIDSAPGAFRCNEGFPKPPPQSRLSHFRHDRCFCQASLIKFRESLIDVAKDFQMRMGD